jgi:phosphonate transport system substrate-binding protein
MRHILLALCLLVSTLPAFQASLHANENTLTFGVVPQQSASKLAQNWVPIMQYLSEQTNTNIVFATAPDIPTFEERLLAGEYDLAYMNPYHFVFFHEYADYEAMAHRADKAIQGLLVTHVNSEVSDLQDLNKQIVVFPSPAAFAATILPQAELALQGVTVRPKYVNSHDSVYLVVANQLFAAGGGITRTLSNIDPKVGGELRILWRTREYTPHAFAAHARLPEPQRLAIAQALVNMHLDPKGQALLSRLGIAQLKAANNADWDDVRQLNLNLLDHLLSAED